MYLFCLCLFSSSVSLVKQWLVQVGKTEALLQSTNRCFVLRLLFRASCLFVALPHCLSQYPCYRYTKERRRGKLGRKRRRTPSPKLSPLSSLAATFAGVPHQTVFSSFFSPPSPGRNYLVSKGYKRVSIGYPPSLSLFSSTGRAATTCSHKVI